MPMPNGIHDATAKPGDGATATPSRPMHAMAAAAQITGRRPYRSERRPPGIAASAVETPTMAVARKTVASASASLNPCERRK